MDNLLYAKTLLALKQTRLFDAYRRGGPQELGGGGLMFLSRSNVLRWLGVGESPRSCFYHALAWFRVRRNCLAELTTLAQSVVSSTLQIKFFLRQWLEGDIFGGGLDEFCGHTYEKI